MSPWIERQIGPWQWQVDPAWHHCLFDSRGLRLDEWRERQLLKVIKQGPHRTVWRVDLPSGTAYVKHYPLSDLRALVRQRLRPSKARTEAERAFALAARQVPTIKPLAFGETSLGESYLVTRGVEPALPLTQFIESLSTTSGPDRFAVTEALARFMAHLHNVGVLHQDLHTGNILVQLDEQRMPALYLIDLHAVRLREPLAWSTSRDNLVMLNRWFVQRSSRQDRRRFWEHYVEARHRFIAEPRETARELEERTWQSCLEFWRHRDRRCLGTNRYFHRVTGDAGRAWAVRDLPVELLKRLLVDPDEPFHKRKRVLKHSRSSTVAEIELEIGGLTRQVIYKRFAVTKWSDPWVFLARPTPALRSWVNGHRLLECGLPTARPLAVIHRQRRGLTHECYLLTEKLPDAVELHKLDPSLTVGALKGRLLDQVAQLVRALHHRQLSHRDLKAANLLVQRDGDRFQLYLIDLVGLERWRRLPRSRRVQNLARLHTSFHNHPWLSRTDRLRFLRTYLAWALHGRAGWKTWWRQIAEATARKIARNLQRGRPLS